MTTWKRGGIIVQSTIIEIGEKAWDESEPMLILFGNKVTKELRPYSIVQEFAKDEKMTDLADATQLVFGEQAYHIERIGRLADGNLHELGHVTLVFGPLPTHDELVNAIYLSPHTLPKVEVGMTIKYL